MDWLHNRLPRAVILLSLTTCMALVCANCGKHEEEAEAPIVAADPVPVDAIVIERSDMPRNVVIAGVVKPMIRAEIAPRLMGRITEVTVNEGDHITQGSILARLDDTTAQAKAQEARAAVGSADAKVNQAKVALELQQTQGEVRISSAEQELNMAKSGARDEEKGQSDQGVTQAESAVEAARAQVEMLNEGARKQERAQATEAVKQGEAAVAQAQASLDKAEAGPRSQELERARQGIEQTKAQKAQANAALDKAREGARSQERLQADESLALAQAEYDTVHATYGRMKALFEAEVISAQAYEEAGLKHRAAAGRLEIARQQTDMVRAGTRTQDVVAAEEQVKLAAAGQREAEEFLAQLEEGTRTEDIDSARQQVRQAEAGLEQSKQQADMVNEGPRSQQIRQAEEALRQAEALAEIARKQRDIAYAGARPEELKLAEDGLRLAQSSAKENELRQRDIEAAEAVKMQAMAAVAAAEVMVADSTIQAPFDAVVIERLADPGDMGMPGMTILVMQPVGQFEIECTVPEAQAKTLQVGQELEATVDAVGPTPIQATISGITPSEDMSSRSSVVELAIPGAEGLKSGLFGRVSIPVGTRKGILVPQTAIWQHESLTGVFLLEEGRAKLRLVRLGKVKDDRVEIISGLEGDPEAPEKVIVSDINRLVDGAPVCPKAS